MTIDPIQYIVRPTTDEEHAMPMHYLTSSMAEAVNTCPRWGIIHNVLGKRFTTGYRQMALEAGSLMHEVFSLLNLIQVGYEQKHLDHFDHHGKLLFGKERWEFIINESFKKRILDPTKDLAGQANILERLIFSCIGSSEFYDDPNDRNRTVANLEHCSLELLQYYMINLINFPIYIEDSKEPTAPIGIEMSFDAVFEIGGEEKIHFTVSDNYGTHEDAAVNPEHRKMRCIGLGDVVYQNPETKAVILGEYKTSSSMNDAWRLAFDTRHQITLYNALLQAYFGRQEDFKTILIGSAIPVRTTSIPVQHFEVRRDQENIQQLLNTFSFTQEIVERYKDNPLATPMFTHSCNRYFRPCSLLDFCTAAKEDQEMMLENMVDAPELSPSEMKALMRNM